MQALSKMFISTLTLSNIYLITNQVKKLGKGCCLYKVAISWPFCHIKIDPHDYDLLGLHHGCYYIDTCLVFGFHHWRAIFQYLSDTVRHIMRQCQFDVLNYMYDVIQIDLIIIVHLDISSSNNKTVQPTTILNCLGIMVDTRLM